MQIRHRLRHEIVFRRQAERVPPGILLAAMATRQAFRESSDLDISATEFLSTLTMAEVNSELMPLARMTVPESWVTKPILEWPVKEHLFVSWILLFGFLPVDKHSICFDTIEQNSGFNETSTSIVNRSWTHRRDVTDIVDGCRVTDTVEFEPRFVFLGPIAKLLYRVTFSHRHKVLRKRYGGSS